MKENSPSTFSSLWNTKVFRKLQPSFAVDIDERAKLAPRYILGKHCNDKSVPISWSEDRNQY